MPSDKASGCFWSRTVNMLLIWTEITAERLGAAMGDEVALCAHGDFTLPLGVMAQRSSVFHGIGIGDQDGCQARVFCNLMRD